VRVRECDPTGLLGAIVYIDLVGRDRTVATSILRDGIYAAVHGRRRHGRAAFPGGDTLR
jgi:hypothetical protein